MTIVPSAGAISPVSLGGVEAPADAAAIDSALPALEVPSSWRSDEPASEPLVDPWLVVAILGAGLLAAFAARPLRQRFEPGRRHENQVLARAGLDAVDRRLLRAVARRAGLPSPVTLLLAASVFDRAVDTVPDLGNRDRRRLDTVRRRRFGLA